MVTTTYKKPLPRPVHPGLTKAFWEATKRHELVVPRCQRCGLFFWYPREECPSCNLPGWEWERVSGKGRVYSHTVVHQPQYAPFNEDVPYVYAIIQLNEGVRMISNVVGCDVHDVNVDMPVEVTFEDVSPDWTLFKFKPVG